MTEEREKIEELIPQETEIEEDNNVKHEKDLRNDGIVMNSSESEPPLSPSQSVDSDSNLKTETSESNSVEFSPDLQTQEADATIKDDANNESGTNVESSERDTSKPEETPQNQEETSNLSEEIAQITPEDNVTGDLKTADTDNKAPDESSVTRQKVSHSNETKIQERKSDDKPVNGLQVKETKEGETSLKTKKQPSKARTRSGKMVFCKVHLLDGQLYETDVTKNATGKELFDKVCGYLTLQEIDYFGLQYVNNNVKFWMNNEKKILKQVKGGTCVFDFSVKFYPPEPLSLLEDISRFQLCLQVRFDIFNGKLPCSFTTLAVLGSYMVQAEVGDYDHVDEYEFGPGDSYLDKIEYAPEKSPEMRSKVYELHRTHKGLTPEEAELQYLENAKKLAMYGVDLHQTRDSQGVKLMLGVCASGIQVYKDKLRINRFVWPAILKLSYKRNNFYVKKRPLEGDKDGETFGFKLDNHKMAKRLWKTCVEHHAFFRLHESDPPKSSTFPRFNSRFRYSGRTQKQVRDDVEKVENHPKFDRSNFKYSSMPQANNADGYTHGFPDEKDRTDQKQPVTTPSTDSGPPPYFNQDPDGYDKMQSHPDKPNSMGEDRRDRTPGQGEAIEMLPFSDGDAAGDSATLEIRGTGKKSKEEKEREKREKEEEKRRKKEEEKEKKRLEKEKKHGKGESAEDRTDKMGDDLATAGYNGDHVPGSTGLDSEKITAPSPTDGTDSRKDLKKQPGAETAIDESYNNSAMGPGVGLTVGMAPLQSDSSEDRRREVSQETDIDADVNRYKGDKYNDADGKASNIHDNEKKKGDGDKRKSDKYDDDDKKKGDKSKRKESDKSKDKKSGFFGRLRSPKDKDSKKGKGKETDIDSPPGSPTSPDSTNQVGFGTDGEMIGRVLPEGEGSIDRRMHFIPVTPPIQETKDSLKHSGDTQMPFFDPASEDTLGRKVPPPVPPKGMRNGFSEEDRLMQDMPPTIPTESFTYENNTDDTPISTKNVPYVKTKTQTVTYEKDGYPYETEDGILISSQSHSTRTQTIETTTYKTEKDGKVETRVEKKVVITDEGDDDDLDHDDLLAEAIRSVTEMNPDLSVERIECMRQIEQVEK